LCVDHYVRLLAGLQVCGQDLRSYAGDPHTLLRESGSPEAVSPPQAPGMWPRR